MITASEFILHCHDVRQNGPGDYTCKCPAHDDGNASLHVKQMDDGGIMLKCFAGCQWKDIVTAAGWQTSDMFPPKEDKEEFRRFGITLAEYSRLKKLSVESLAMYGLKDHKRTTRGGKPYDSVDFPYWSPDGQTVMGLRFRKAAHKNGKQDFRFEWEEGSHLCLYGQWMTSHWDKKSVMLVEGESDTQTLVINGYQALGVPGAANYNADRDDPILDRFDIIYVYCEPDTGGKTMFTRFAGDDRRQPSKLLHKMRFWSLYREDAKDVSALWSGNPVKSAFRSAVDAAIQNAAPADGFRRPEQWEDKRKETSPENGQKGGVTPDKANGGRPQADYYRAATCFASEYMDDEGNYLWRHWHETWWCYDGGKYVRRSQSVIENELMEWIQTSPAAALSHVQPSANALRNLVMNLRSTKFFGIRSDKDAPFRISDDSDCGNVLPLANGILDIDKAAEIQRRMEADEPVDDLGNALTPLSADVMVTYSIPYEYDQTAGCATFDSYLAKVCPDADTRETLLRMMGVCLTPESYERAFFLYGPQGTGKGTFLEVLQMMMGGENVCSVPMAQWDEGKANNQLWQLTEHLVNVDSDFSDYGDGGTLRKYEATFKKVVSGEVISAEKKYENSYAARCIATNVWACNQLPEFFDKSGACWKKTVVIPFFTVIRGTDDEIHDFENVLKPELPGILNRALAALGRLRASQRNVFVASAWCEKVKGEWVNRCDQTGEWLRESFTFTPNSNGGGIMLSDAYKLYKDWLLDNGMKVRNSSTFQEEIYRNFGVRATPKSLEDRRRVFVGLYTRVQLPGGSEWT